MNQSYHSSRLLPIGIQDFEKLRSEGFLYVDKTAFVYRLAQSKLPYFLSRPRRFGKSLLLSTFKAYFEGKKELFRGLAIEQLEQHWYTYPVLHLDLNAEDYSSPEWLDNKLVAQLKLWEKTYGVTNIDKSRSERFINIIKAAYTQTGRRVVVLIDEYDKPLLKSISNEKLQEEFRDMLTAFYTVLKSADPYLQFVFITGVTKFAQMGIFSTLNQLNDISFQGDYNALCGMTCEEIEHTFVPELNKLAADNDMSYDEAMAALTRQYDGYRFTKLHTFAPVYNPFSVLNALDKSSFDNYWFASGTPTFLVEMLKQTKFDLSALDGIEVKTSSLSDDRADVDNPIPMIYQSGYLTIKSYNARFQTYTLGFPNDEVKYGFLNFAAPFYTSVPGVDTAFNINKFVLELEAGNIEAFLRRMRAFFADMPYELNDQTERHYQVVFYIVFKLLGQYTNAEVHSAFGRADMVVMTPDYIYVFEFKLFDTAEAALMQINDKGYPIPYSVDGRKLFKIGVEFDAETRNLGRWLIE
jgi:hypothetical protein